MTKSKAKQTKTSRLSWTNTKPNKPMSKIISLTEPKLQFAMGEELEHPRDGLTLFGPIDSKGIEKPNHICYAAFGTTTGLEALDRFIQTMNGPIKTADDLE